MGKSLLYKKGKIIVDANYGHVNVPYKRQKSNNREKKLLIVVKVFVISCRPFFAFWNGKIRGRQKWHSRENEGGPRNIKSLNGK